MIFLADMAFWMSNFDDFDSNQISWKLAQRLFFVFAFYSKIFFYLGNQDDSKNAKWNLFKNHPILSRQLSVIRIARRMTRLESIESIYLTNVLVLGVSSGIWVCLNVITPYHIWLNKWIVLVLRSLVFLVFRRLFIKGTFFQDSK